jgi:hypothetical protein
VEYSIEADFGTGTNEMERTGYFSTFFLLPIKQTFESSSTSLKRIIVVMFFLSLIGFNPER